MSSDDFEQNSKPSALAKEELRAKLESEILSDDWKAFEHQLARQAVFLLSPELSLAEVGAAIALDETSSVQTWIESAQLSRPTSSQIELWNSKNGLQFRFLIIQPYVLIQAHGH